MTSIWLRSARRETGQLRNAYMTDLLRRCSPCASGIWETEIRRKIFFRTDLSHFFRRLIHIRVRVHSKVGHARSLSTLHL